MSLATGRTCFSSCAISSVRGFIGWAWSCCQSATAGGFFRSRSACKFKSWKAGSLGRPLSVPGDGVMSCRVT